MIDFYILDTPDKQKSLHFACQLIEKAYAAQKNIYLHTASLEAADQWDTLLWIYRDDSFIPHQLYAKDQEPVPVLIGHDDNITLTGDLLFNFNPAIPAFYKQFNHIIEIVFSEVNVQQWGRERYKQYRQDGNTINTHKLKANEI